jgi:hypothetical protein
MGIAYHLNQDLGVSLVVWDGLVTATEWQAHARRMLADTRWPARKGLHLVDMRSTRLDASIDEAAIKATADLFGQHPRIAALKAAVVAGEAFTRAAQFERIIAQYRSTLITFNILATACAWMGLDTTAVEPELQAIRAELRAGA